MRNLILTHIMLSALQLIASGSEPIELIVIYGKSNVGKSTLADSVAEFYNKTHVGSASRLSIDNFFQPLFYFDYLTIFVPTNFKFIKNEASLLSHSLPADWDTFISTPTEDSIERKKRPYVAKFFSSMGLSPRQAYEHYVNYNYRKEFEESIKKNLVNHKPVIIDLSRLDSAWIKFFQTIIPQHKIYFLKLTATFEKIKERNSERNHSENILDHRPLPVGLYVGVAEFQKEVERKLLKNLDERFVRQHTLDTSTITRSGVLQATLQFLIDSED